AAHVANSGGTAELLQLAEAPLAHGIVGGGEVRDPEGLALALRGFFEEHKLPRASVRLGIANDRIGVRLFELSGIEDPAQVANAIRFRAQDTLPIPLDEAVLDWRVVGETPSENGSVTRRVLLVVAHRGLVDSYVTACRRAGLKLEGIDL